MLDTSALSWPQGVRGQCERRGRASPESQNHDTGSEEFKAVWDFWCWETPLTPTPLNTGTR